jgi:hypothetical protein
MSSDQAMFGVGKFGGCEVFSSEIVKVTKLQEAVVDSREFRSFVSEQMRRYLLKC